MSSIRAKARKSTHKVGTHPLQHRSHQLLTLIFAGNPRRFIYVYVYMGIEQEDLYYTFTFIWGLVAINYIDAL